MTSCKGQQFKEKLDVGHMDPGLSLSSNRYGNEYSILSNRVVVIQSGQYVKDDILRKSRFVLTFLEILISGVF